jgi:hypothetical protein
MLLHRLAEAVVLVEVVEESVERLVGRLVVTYLSTWRLGVKV